MSFHLIFFIFNNIPDNCSGIGQFYFIIIILLLLLKYWKRGKTNVRLNWSKLSLVIASISVSLSFWMPKIYLPSSDPQARWANLKEKWETARSLDAEKGRLTIERSRISGKMNSPSNYHAGARSIICSASDAAKRWFFSGAISSHSV